MSDAIQQAIKNLEWIKESARIGGRHGSWTKAQEAIEALQAMQSGEPSEWVIEVENGQVVMSRIGANFTGYLYTASQPMVPEGYRVERGSVTYNEILVTAPDGGQQTFWPDDAAYEVIKALLSAGKENNNG